MLALLLKEINTFFNGLIGYIVVIVFLTINGLFMWLIPGGYNILENGFANIDTLFVMAPVLFLLLIPAITMRSLAEEKRTGTLEILLTKPLTDLQIILAKYFAGVLLVIISLLPTLVYYFSVKTLGNPPNNIDSGAVFGAYLGLLFLASAFVAIGIFASSITDNQIVAFIVAILLSAFFYFGFDIISSFNFLGIVGVFIQNMGINEHYISMSRGVIDSRDIMYFLTLNIIFILFTRTVLQSRKW